MKPSMIFRDAPTLDRASDLGLAFQLTNIARDVVDDAKADRVFVPKDLLLAAGAPTSSSLPRYRRETAQSRTDRVGAKGQRKRWT